MPCFPEQKLFRFLTIPLPLLDSFLKFSFKFTILSPNDLLLSKLLTVSLTSFRLPDCLSGLLDLSLGTWVLSIELCFYRLGFLSFLTTGPEFECMGPIGWPLFLPPALRVNFGPLVETGFCWAEISYWFWVTPTRSWSGLRAMMSWLVFFTFLFCRASLRELRFLPPRFVGVTLAGCCPRLSEGL